MKILIFTEPLGQDVFIGVRLITTRGQGTTRDNKGPYWKAVDPKQVLPEMQPVIQHVGTFYISIPNHVLVTRVSVAPNTGTRVTVCARVENICSQFQTFSLFSLFFGGGFVRGKNG